MPEYGHLSVNEMELVARIGIVLEVGSKKVIWGIFN